MSSHAQPLPAFWMPTDAQGIDASGQACLAPADACGSDGSSTADLPLAGDPWTALRTAHERAPERDLLLLRRDLALPPGYGPRLLAAWHGAGGIDVLSCLDASLLPMHEAVDATGMDARCWQQGEHAVFASSHVGMHGSLWRATALARLFAGDPSRLLPGLRSALLPCAWLPSANGVAVSTAEQAWLLPTLEPRHRNDGLRALGDGRPVLLHVLHAWGGGIECFARDLQAGDDQRHHLFLLSQHDNYEAPFGRRLSLFADLDAPALRTWELARAIEDTATDSPEVQSLLQAIIAEWGVGAVLVSSLIGHSLDVLRSGLPTAVCVHDVYPLWPLLHDGRDPHDAAFDADTLTLRLADPGEPSLFRQRDAGHWQRLRQAYVDTLADQGITMVAPSEFARQRLCTIEPQLRALDWQQIAHGAPPLKPQAAAIAAPDRQAGILRVVVPGHIPGGKGEWLLRELLPRLDRGFEVFLLGAGPAGLPFRSLPHVRYLEHYQREQLPALLADFQPDLALLPSTVPETWGYVLSEMLQLGVPVLASRLGAYAERLREGAGGWLVEPNADAMLVALQSLRDQREKLQVPATLADNLFSDPARMAAAWGQVLPALPFAPRLSLADGRQVQALAERWHWRQRLARLELEGERLREHHRMLEDSVVDEREQRHLLECDLGIKQGRLEIAEEEQRGLRASQETLRQEMIGQLQSLSLLEDQLARSTRDLAEARADRQRLLLLEQSHAQECELRQRLQHELAARDEQLHGLRAEISAQQQSRAEVEQQMAGSQAALIERDALLTSTRETLAEADTRILALGARAETLEHLNMEAAIRLQQAELATAAAQDQLQQVQTTLADVYQSRSWRITAGPRALKLALLAWRASLQYRITRATQWLHRARASLRSRGLRSSWQRFRQQTDPLSPAPAALALPGRDLRPLAFAVVSAPKASIIVPVYNQIPITLDCLASIANHGADCAFEVIVVDDASTDEAAAELGRIPGLRLHRNPDNLGFIGACNAGAALARGEFLVFLNNDTLVQAHWLDALLATFAEHPDTGLAGSKLVYPDGRLQEAGGIVFSDASGWNYGRYADPAHPDFNFVREADYCSGAAIALRRSLFNELGGFDSHYAPAYYEDTDLAMRVRQHGLKVRYQPASMVVHLEGATSGTDLQQGVKAYQVANQRKFLDRWRTTLEREHPAPGGDIVIASAHRRRRRVLVIDACTPTPDRDSGSVRMFEILRLLVEEGHAVSFFADNRMHDGAYSDALQQLGVQVWWHPWLADVPSWLREHGPRLDAIIVSRHYVLTPLLPLLRQFAAQARIVFDTVDLHFLREQREAEQRDEDAARRTAARTREAELSLINSVDETWVVSPVEQALLAGLAPGARIEVLSNIHRPRGLGPGFEARADLMFVGGYRHTPNVDAALWLATEIFPLIRLRRPELRLHLIGADTPDSVRALAERPGIIVHGHVPDLTPLLDRMRINLAPLRYGAGVKGKINHSLAHGLPVVATTCAAEGMNLSDRIDAMVADSAADFARAVIELYEDPQLWQQLAEAGLENTHRHFSPERARPVLRELLG